MKQLILRIREYLKKYRRRFLVGLGFCACFYFGFVVLYQRPYHFNYGSDNCFRDIRVFPGLYKPNQSTDYKLEAAGLRKVMGRSVLATRLCVIPQKTPSGRTSKSTGLKVFGVPAIGKQFKIVTPELPKLSAASLGSRISIRNSIKIDLSASDRTFTYKLIGNDRSGSCEAQDQKLICDVKALQLAQNKEYKLSVTRQFRTEKADVALTSMFQTTDPVVIAASSVTDGGIIYDIPTQFTITASRGLTTATIDLAQLEGQASKEVPFDIKLDGARVSVTLGKPLERRKSFRMTVKDLEATDKGVLLAPQLYSFSTSGGPKVTGASIGARSVPTGKAIYVNFDQALQPDQAVGPHVTVLVGGQAVPVQAVVTNNQVKITPSTDWGLCTPFTIKVDGALVSNYGLSGDSTWQLNSRTICYSISTIGYSVSGRAIQAWRFGSGADKILFVGATHGNELSTKLLLEEWIKELDANPTKLPASKTIIVVPSLNPDGVAAKNRLNSRGVDLNRNFPANDWKSDVTMPGSGGVAIKNGGGSVSLSEPESKVISDYVLNQRPKLVLTYHSSASVVSGNLSGTSDSLAVAYAKQAKYSYLPKSDTNQVFQYDTTGAFEDWLHDKHDIPAILVELGSDTKSGFSKNKDAMWAILSSI